MFRAFRLLALVPLVALCAVAAQADLDDQDSVVASLQVNGLATLSLQPKNISDNANASGVSFTLPNPGETLVLAQQYVEISYSTNFDNWKIKTYTNNGIPADGSSYYGALIHGTDTAYKMYVHWQVKDTVTTPSLTPGNWWDPWAGYMDVNDPGFDENSNELQVAYGGTWDGGWAKMRDGSNCASPINLYMAGSATGLKPGSYTAKIYFDLVHL